MNKPNEKTDKPYKVDPRLFDSFNRKSHAQPAERTQGYKPGYLRHTRAVLQQTTADLQTAVDYIGKLEQERDEARAQVADLLAELKRLVHDVRVNFPEADPFLLRGSDAAIAVAEGRQS